MDEASLMFALPARSLKLPFLLVVEEITPEEACELCRIDCLLVTNLLAVSLELGLCVIRNLGELILCVTMCEALNSEAASEEGGSENHVSFQGT